MSYNNNVDREIAGIVKKHLSLNGFVSADVAFFDSQDWYRRYGGQDGMFQTVREVLESTLSNGYFLFFLDNQSWYTQGELELAYEIAPNMILPITINDSNNPFNIDKASDMDTYMKQIPSNQRAEMATAMRENKLKYVCR